MSIGLGPGRRRPPGDHRPLQLTPPSSPPFSYTEALKEYLASNRPYFGICLGMQTLFRGSSETPGVAGLGVIDSDVSLFNVPGRAVPHMGWNGINVRKPSSMLQPGTEERYYFVHSFMALQTEGVKDWVLATTDYGVPFVSAVQKGNIVATQFHPEKSGQAGLELLRRFLMAPAQLADAAPLAGEVLADPAPTALAPRLIACLDVRTNDGGDLVVTKGDQ